MITRAETLILYLMMGSIFLPQTQLPAAEDLSGPLLLVANKGDRSLGLIAPDSDRQFAEVAVEGVTGHEVAASPDGRLAFVPIYGNSGVGGQGTDGQLIRVVDLRKRQIIHTINYGKGVRPHCAVFGPKDGLLYVTAELDQAVSVFDPNTFQLQGSIPTGAPESHMLAISPDGRLGYTANVGPGSISVLDLRARKLITTIPVSAKVQRICVAADGKRVFTADQTQHRLAVIDAGSNALSAWIQLPGKAYGTAATPDGHYLVAALPGLNRLALVDLQKLAVTATLEVPKAPQEVLLRPDGAMAYVSCDASGQVAAVDLKAWKVARLITAGAGADGLAWAPVAR